MSREIKFRAWDKVLKRWCKGGLCMRIDGYGLDSNRYELMQYTGFKDKNGVEIYEGDIVCFWHKTNPYGVRKLLAKVIFENVSFTIRHISDNFLDGLITLESGDEFEVIGNIYENPELLGTEK